MIETTYVNAHHHNYIGRAGERKRGKVSDTTIGGSLWDIRFRRLIGSMRLGDKHLLQFQEEKQYRKLKEKRKEGG